MVRKQEVSQDGLTSRSSHFRDADGIAASPLGQHPPTLVITLSSLLWPCKSELAPGAALPIAYTSVEGASRHRKPIRGFFFFSFLNQRIPRHAAANTREDRKWRGVSGRAEQEVKVLYCTLGGKWLQLTMLKKKNQPNQPYGQLTSGSDLITEADVTGRAWEGSR